jgi:hypothetical protein
VAPFVYITQSSGGACGELRTFLFRAASEATYERYTRALNKLFTHFEDKRFVYEFRRPDIEDFKEQRLKDGLSPTTVNIELSCIARSLISWSR